MEIGSHEFESPLSEIRPFAEGAARNFRTYLEFNRGSFSVEECEEIVGVLLSLSKLMPLEEGSVDTEHVLALMEHFEDPKCPRIFNLEKVQKEVAGDRARESQFTPFGLMRLYANMAAESICRLLKAKKGQLSLDECQEVRRIFRNFEPLLADSNYSSLPDSQHLIELQKLVFPYDSHYQDEYLSLVENYGSEEARAGLVPIAPLPPITVEEPSPLDSGLGSIKNRLSGVLSSLFGRATNEP